MFGIKRASCIYGNFFEIWQCEGDDDETIAVFDRRDQAEEFVRENGMICGYSNEGEPEYF